MNVPAVLTYLQIATVRVVIVNNYLQVGSVLNRVIVPLDEVVRSISNLIQDDSLGLLCVSNGFPVWSWEQAIRQTKSESHWKMDSINSQFAEVKRIIDIIQTNMQIIITRQLRKLEEFMACNYKVISDVWYIKVDTLKISELLLDFVLKTVSIIILDRYNHLDTIRLICGCFIEKVNSVDIFTLVHHILAFHSILTTDKIEA